MRVIADDFLLHVAEVSASLVGLFFVGIFLYVQTVLGRGRDDLALPPGEFWWAPRFPDRLPGAPLIYTPGSHEAVFTQPEPLAHAFIEAAAG